MKKITFLCFVLTFFFACNEATENNTTTTTDKVTEVPTNQSGTLSEADKVAITDAVHNFYKWYEAFTKDEKRAIDFIDSKGKYAKVDKAKFAIYSAEMMKSGLISQAFIDNEVTFLTGLEAEWKKNNENGNEGLTGLDMDTNFCGQDWDIKAYTMGAINAEGLGTNQAKATVEGSKIELVKDNGKWLIAKISCQ